MRNDKSRLQYLTSDNRGQQMRSLSVIIAANSGVIEFLKEIKVVFLHLTREQTVL